MLDVAGPLQVFASANELAAGTARRRFTRLGWCRPASGRDRLRRAGAGGRAAIACAGGAGHADRRWRSGRARGRRRSGGAWTGCGPGRSEARRIASVCTGAFLLAAAGLLNGRRAATHWMHCAELARRFPAIRVEPDPIFVRDGAIWTSAGVTAAHRSGAGACRRGRGALLGPCRGAPPGHVPQASRAGRRSSALSCRFSARKIASARCTIGWRGA